jgi:four helix bundle protein
MPHAVFAAMTVRNYKELIIWQLADELRREVYRLTDEGPVVRDFKFREQLRSAASKIAPNISEGFRRFTSNDFAKFLDYAFASAGETADWLDDGVARRHWTEAELERARTLLRRLDPGLTKLMRYLRSSAGQSRSKRTRPKTG